MDSWEGLSAKPGCREGTPKGTVAPSSASMEVTYRACPGQDNGSVGTDYCQMESSFRDPNPHSPFTNRDEHWPPGLQSKSLESLCWSLSISSGERVLPRSLRG